jgi:hypothetical protein
VSSRCASCLAGAVLVVVGLAGAAEALRAGRGQALYHAVRYRDGASLTPEDADRRMDRAHRWYPHNVYASIWIAEKAYYTDPDRPLTAEREASAERWCTRGLRQNRYRRELRLLRTYLLMHRDPAAALAVWRRYTEWDFWSPFNQSVLAELYARTGDFYRARQALRWTIGTPHEAAARRAIREAWERELRGP